MVLPRHDIRVLLPPTLPRGKRFETEADAEEYRDAAIDKLRTPWRGASTQELRRALTAATTLEECRDRYYDCDEPFCPVCMRPFRVWLSSHLLRLNGRLAGPAYVGTLLVAEIPFGRLETWNIGPVHEELENNLHAAGLECATIVGGTEVSRRRGHRSWVGHLNLAVWGVRIHRLRELEARYGEALKDAGSDVKRPFIPVKLKDAPEQLSYLQKFTTYQRPGRQIGNIRPRAAPLNTPQHNELIRWMANYRPSDFLFRQNVPRNLFQSVRWGIE